MIVHRVINHRFILRNGKTLYLVKWRDLGYDLATWEEEDDSILGLKTAIEYYMDLRACCNVESGKRPRKGKLGKRTKTRELQDEEERGTP